MNQVLKNMNKTTRKWKHIKLSIKEDQRKNHRSLNTRESAFLERFHIELLKYSTYHKLGHGPGHGPGLLGHQPNSWVETSYALEIA